jgi:hypothetical protein
MHPAILSQLATLITKEKERRLAQIPASRARSRRR